MPRTWHRPDGFVTRPRRDRWDPARGRAPQSSGAARLSFFGGAPGRPSSAVAAGQADLHRRRLSRVRRRAAIQSSAHVPWGRHCGPAVPGSRLDADHPQTGSLFHAASQYSPSIVRVTCLRLSSRWISAHRGGDGLAWCRPQRSAASSALSVISAGNGQLNPALASRFKVNRTVDGATPTRRAISLSPTPAVSNEPLRAPGASMSSVLASTPPCKSQRSGP